MSSTKKLYRSNQDKILLGVCGGLATYFNIDATVIRLLWALVTIFSGGLGLIGYIVSAVIMPTEN
jgi:phage shock protein C